MLVPSSTNVTPSWLQTYLRTYHHLTLIHSHRILRAGRDLWKPSSPTPLYWTGTFSILHPLSQWELVLQTSLLPEITLREEVTGYWRHDSKNPPIAQRQRALITHLNQMEVTEMEGQHQKSNLASVTWAHLWLLNQYQMHFQYVCLVRLNCK